MWGPKDFEFRIQDFELGPVDMGLGPIDLEWDSLHSGREAWRFGMGASIF